MTYVEQDGIWHVVERVTDDGPLTRCTRVLEADATMVERDDDPRPLCSRCRDSRR